MDDYQIEIPASFLALYLDGRKRLTTSLAALRERYGLCEDLSQQLVEHCKSVHVEIGVNEQDVLERCHRGLLADGSGLRADEAGWVVTRLAELLDWPALPLPPPLD